MAGRRRFVVTVAVRTAGRGFALGFAAFLWVAGVVAQTVLPPGFSEIEVVAPGGLRRPTAMAFAPDGRLFICEQSGTIRILKDGALLPQAFGSVPALWQNERGLLGIAFDPAFAANGWIYLCYTAALPQPHNRVSRVTALGDQLVAGSEVVVFELPPLEASFHNAGAIHFGGDGSLFVAVGDNGISTNAQWMGTLKGKLLRLNTDGSIPTTNPFYTTTLGDSRAIWALGLRNPFTFTFSSASGRMFINDVGERRWEEINDGIAGANYGWPLRAGGGGSGPYVPPIHAYEHPTNYTGSMAITGGLFYEPATAKFPPEYFGRYFFLDGGQQWIRVLDPATATAAEFAPRLGPGAGEMPLALTLGDDGAMYYLKNTTGALLRIQFTGQPQPIIGTQPRNQGVTIGAEAAFVVSAFGAPPLAFAWEMATNGSGDFTAVSGEVGPVLRVPAAQLAQNQQAFRCRVRNDFGAVVSDAATLRVTENTAPVAVIVTPVAGQTYRAGQTIAFNGSATDREDGALPARALTWWVDFHHLDHVHPGVPAFSGASGGSFVVPTVGETSDAVWYRIHLVAVDAGGARTEVTRDVLPQKSRVTLTTQPPGMALLLDGAPVNTPLTVVGVVGMQRLLGAAAQTLNGAVYDFARWSDGGGAAHSVVMPVTDTTYTATFVPRGAGYDSAAFAGQNVPTRVLPGRTNFVTVAFTNTGTTVWSEGARYRLASVSLRDNTIWGLNRVLLPAPVNPGQVATFRFPMRAPLAAGTYNFQWQLVREGVAFIGKPSPLLQITVGALVRDAQFVSQSVPTRVVTNGVYQVRVQFLNTGTQTWRASDPVRLAAQSPMDNLYWGVQRALLKADVAPGQMATFDFKVNAPSAPGTYPFCWQMVREGLEVFGELAPSVLVVVNGL